MTRTGLPGGVTFNVAVVGTGVMGKNHVRAATELEGVDLAGLYDADRATAESLANRFGTQAYGSLDDLLADAAVDAVVVATPTVFHVETALCALDAGKHVLVEKPIAPTVKEGAALVAAAESAGLTLAVGHVERHNPVVRYGKDALDAGDFGTPVTFATRRVSNFPGRIRDVGCILDLGVHDVDVLRYMVGRPVTRVFARAGSFTEGLAFEDHASILLEFEGGLTGLVEVNWLTPMKVRKLSLTASEAFVELDYMEQRAVVSSSRFREHEESRSYNVPLELNVRTINLQKQEPLKLELLDFAGAATGRSAPLVTGADGVAVIAIAEAALESSRTGQAVAVDA